MRVRPTTTCRTRALTGLLVLLAALAAFAVVVAPGALLALAPTLLLFGTLLAGAMPGEELLHRLRARFAPRARRRRPARPRTYRAVHLRRVGRLIAAALAVRPPPAAPATVVAS
ncbi:hypothetical protein [Paraconexibacter algicola]|uniref:hypothetical protein n=1 Tax=Paraconexibacter algicola TaxID=2133960 RepID=UPI001E2A1F60|nr:hypothetical protein [Paraconexibacter algicola]